MPFVSIVMPTYKATAHIGRTVRSVIAQTHDQWELVLVSDDLVDYEAVLSAEGLTDSRIRYVSTGLFGGGAQNARNVGLQHATHPLIAQLDSDDLFFPDKLARCVPHVAHTGLVACAVDVQTDTGHHLRYVGNRGEDRLLTPTQYFHHHYTSYSHIVFDRNRITAMYDTTVPVAQDVWFLFDCFEQAQGIYYVTEPLQVYHKLTTGISGGEDVSVKYKQVKQKLLDRVSSGHYAYSAETQAGLTNFMQLTMQAEAIFEKQIKKYPQTLFEDIIEKLLSET